MARKITTLFIDETGLRLMVTSGRRIHKLADSPLDMTLADVSVKVKEAELVAKIKQLFKAQKVSAKKVIVGVSGLHCLSRPITLPELPKAMLGEAVIREAKRVLPVPLEQLHISWQAVSVTEGKFQVFMEAIPRQTTDNLLSVLHQAGLKPYIMDIKPLALARLVKEATAIIIDVQPKEFDIVIMADGMPQPIRTVPFPDEALSQQEKLLMVRDELKRTIQFYNSNNPEKPIQPNVTIFASGELADEPELGESLSNEMGYPVSLLSSPLKCPKQMDLTHYLVNVGLALKELRREAGPLLANVNTMPVAYQPKPISFVKMFALPGIAITIGLLVVLGMAIQDASAGIASAQDQLDSANFILKQKQDQKQELTNKIAEMEGKLAQAEANRNLFITTFDGLQQSGNSFNDDLNAIVKNLVSGIEIGGFGHSGSRISLGGTAPSEVEVLQYARNLETCGRFSEVVISNMGRYGVAGTEDSGMSFALNIKIEGSD